MWLCNYNGFTSAVVISESKQYGSNHTPRTAGTAYWPSNPRRRLSQSHLTTDTAMAVLPYPSGGKSRRWSYLKPRLCFPPPGVSSVSISLAIV